MRTNGATEKELDQVVSSMRRQAIKKSKLNHRRMVAAGPSHSLKSVTVRQFFFEKGPLSQRIQTTDLYSWDPSKNRSEWVRVPLSGWSRKRDGNGVPSSSCGGSPHAASPSSCRFCASFTSRRNGAPITGLRTVSDSQVLEQRSGGIQTFSSASVGGVYRPHGRRAGDLHLEGRAFSEWLREPAACALPRTRKRPRQPAFLQPAPLSSDPRECEPLWSPCLIPLRFNGISRPARFIRPGASRLE